MTFLDLFLYFSEKEEEEEEEKENNEEDSDGENKEKKDSGQQGPWKGAPTNPIPTTPTGIVDVAIL